MNDPFDVCRCGDYRYQHVGGVGRCKMPDDLIHGFAKCHNFRLLYEARPAHKNEWRPERDEAIAEMNKTK